MNTQDPPADGFVLPAAGSQSEAVRAAQEKLLEIRRSLGIEPGGRDTNDERRATSDERRDHPCSPAPLPPRSLSPLPSSYHSETLSRHLRAAAERRRRHEAAGSREWLDAIRQYESGIRNQARCAPAPFPPCSPAQDANDATRDTHEERDPDSYLVSRISYPVKVYPDLALGMLRRKKAAPGRVWLLLRHADASGRGRMAVADAARLLSGDGSPLRICGRRQLANLLAAGDGLFWERDTGRDGAEWLRFRSVARVAAALGVRRLAGSPVAVPVAALTGTIGQARAHLYASFHSGRTRADLLTGERRARGPISRDALCQLSGAAANSQRNYERRAGVARRAAVAVGPPVTAAEEQEMAWRRGRALFRLRDDRGRFGRPGAVYLAWQLPNEYTGPHDTLPRGRRKRLNRALADLFHDGMTGNGERNEGQCSVVSDQYSVGQWVSGSVNLENDEGSAAAGRRESPRRFYATARAAHGARHGGERYWRYGGAWLWQPEIRDKTYEIRGQAAGPTLQVADQKSLISSPRMQNSGEQR